MFKKSALLIIVDSDLISCETLDCLQSVQYLSLEMKQLVDKHFKNLNQFSPNLLTLNIDSNYSIISDKTTHSLTKMTQLRTI